MVIDFVTPQTPAVQGKTLVPTMQVDYVNVEETARILESNAVQVFVSALDLKTAQGGVAEVNLVAAAAKSSTTRRFMASDWALPTSHDP
jgi:hypothetical protein